MSKIALIADSTSDLTKEEIQKYNIHILPLRVIYKDREYFDGVDITPDEIYEKLPLEVPTTSLPSIREVTELFIKLEKEGYTHVIGVFISSALSGTYNCIKLISNDFPNIKCFIFDSLSVSIGAGGVILECAEMINAGKSYDEIIECIPLIKERTKMYYILDTLSYFKKGGRADKVCEATGNYVDIRPVMSINEQGIIYTYTKTRGRRQSILKLAEIAAECVSQKKAKVWVLHGGALEECKALHESISKLPNVTSLSMGSVSSVWSVHSGPGHLVLAVVNEE